MIQTNDAPGNTGQSDSIKLLPSSWIGNWETYWSQNPKDAIAALKELTDVLQSLQASLGETSSSPVQSNFSGVEIQFLQQAEKIVLEHIHDEAFSVHQLSKLMNISYRQLHRKLQVTAESSPAIFIRKIRLNKAHELLRKKLEKPTQVAYMVGFYNSSFFSSCFKKQFGVTPLYVYKNG